MKDGIEIASLLISGFSLVVAGMAYWQSVPKLRLNIFIGSEYDVVTHQKCEQEIIYVSVVNTSSRPVTIMSLCGSYDSVIGRRVKSWLGMKLTAFVWQDVGPLIFNDKGEFKTILDGEFVSHRIPLNRKKSDRAGLREVRKIKRIWVSDAAGREYSLPYDLLKKFKKDFTSLD